MLNNLVLLSFSIINIFQYLEHLELLSPEIVIFLVSLQIDFLFVFPQCHLLIRSPVVEGSMRVLVIIFSLLPEAPQEGSVSPVFSFRQPEFFVNFLPDFFGEFGVFLSVGHSVPVEFHLIKRYFACKLL